MSRSYCISQLAVLLVLACCGAITAIGQSSVNEFRDVLRNEAGFAADDFSALERGETVVKLLPVADQREVAVAGLMRLQLPLAVSLQAFRESTAQRNRKSLLEIGKFGNPPTLEDLRTLTLENRDIEDLKKCEVGDCQLKISAGMMERFRKEVDWSASDYKSQATHLFRQMLLDYVRDYLARGDSALIEYQDQSRWVRLDEEHRSLLEESLYVNRFAPELIEYLKAFPRAQLTEVENTIVWTKIKFGLKPVTIITHVATYHRRLNGVPQILVVSKQLYANHYFDSSLALTALITIPITNTTSDSYLLYTNRSRADALGGMFSTLKRNLVEGEAIDNLQAILVQTRMNLERNSINQSGSAPPAGVRETIEWLFSDTAVSYSIITIALLVAMLLLWKLHARHNAAGLWERAFRSRSKKDAQ